MDDRNPVAGGDWTQAAAAGALADVGRAIATSRETHAVLDLIVDRACALLAARQSFVVLVAADERLRIAASRGLVGQLRELLPRHDRDGVAMAAMTERRAVWSADVMNDPAIDLSPPSRAFIEGEGYRAALAVPLLADTRVLGALVTCRDEVGGFLPEQIELARAFATHAAIALEHARLSALETARLRLDEALLEVERELLGELSSDRLLPLIVEHASRLVGGSGSIYLAEPGRRWLRHGWTNWPQPLAGIPFGEGIAGGLCRGAARAVGGGLSGVAARVSSRRRHGHAPRHRPAAPQPRAPPRRDLHGPQ